MAALVLAGHLSVGLNVFAVSPLFWSQAIITEVYTLNTLFVGALLLIATHLALSSPQEQARDERLTFKMALFGFLLGLGLGNHLTLLAIAVPLIFWLWATLGWRKLASPWTIGPLVLGLAIYVYALVRMLISVSGEVGVRLENLKVVSWSGSVIAGQRAWVGPLAFFALVAAMYFCTALSFEILEGVPILGEVGGH